MMLDEDIGKLMSGTFGNTEFASATQRKGKIKQLLRSLVIEIAAHQDEFGNKVFSSKTVGDAPLPDVSVFWRTQFS
jgi:hypothetical protein